MVVHFPAVTGYPLGITRNPRTMHSELHIGVLVIGLAGVEESVGGVSARVAVPQAFLEDTMITIQFISFCL